MLFIGTYYHIESWLNKIEMRFTKCAKMTTQVAEIQQLRAIQYCQEYDCDIACSLCDYFKSYQVRIYDVIVKKNLRSPIFIINRDAYVCTTCIHESEHHIVQVE